MRPVIDATLPWVKNYDRVVHDSFEVPTGTISQNFQASASKFPNRICLQSSVQSLTYLQVNEASQKVAVVLQILGYQKGDVIALLLPNTCWLAICYLGILKMGGVVVLVSPVLTSAEILFQLQDSAAKCLITEYDYLQGSKIPARVQTSFLRHKLYVTEPLERTVNKNLPQYWYLKLQQACERLLSGVKVSSQPGFAKQASLNTWNKNEEVQDLNQLMHLFKERSLIPVNIQLNDLALIQYTGGITGVIKGAMLTQGNLSFNVNQLRSWFYFFKEGEENFLAAIPFCQIFGLAANLNLAFKIGATITLIPHFSLSSFAEALNLFKPTVLTGVPALYAQLLDSPGIETLKLSSINNYFSGHAALGSEIKERWLDLTGLEIIEGYGLTEAAPVVAINPLYGLRKEGSVGLPLPLTQVKIMPLPEFKMDKGKNNLGEVLLKGPQITSGYWQHPTETQMAFTDDGWLKTGDVGYLDEDGYLFLVDRLKDVVNVHGYTVFTREIDELVQKHPGVDEAVAVGQVGILENSSIKLFVVTKPNFKVSEEDILTFCKQSLAAYKIPSAVEFVAQLPKAENGEVLKKNLRSQMGHAKNGLSL